MPRLFPDSSPVVRRFLAGVLLNSLGGGLTLPILVIYLHSVRGLSLLQSSLVLSWMALVGLFVSPAFGALVDRIGPKRVLLSGIVCSVVGALGWIGVHTWQQAMLVSAVVAVANSASWPPQSTLAARMVDEDQRQKLFGWQFMMLNLGLGLGGLVSAVIVNVDHPVSFTYLFILDAVSFVIFFCFIVTLRGQGKAPELELDDAESEHGYREVLRDRLFMKLNILGVVMLMCGYASLDAGLPILLSTVGHLPVKALGPIWAVNTGTIVVSQLFVLKRIEGRSRTKLLGLVGVLWATCWLLVWIGIGLSPVWTFSLAAMGIAIFALGETLWSPIGPTLANELAPEHLRGRYSAVTSLVWVISGALGPAISGVMLGAHLVTQWFVLLMAGALGAGFLSVRLGRSLTAKQDGRA
jgi:MFS family permease